MLSRSIALPLVLSAGALALVPSAGQAKDRTQTLRFFDKPVSMKLTHADGTVVARPPFPEARPGDTLDVDSLDFRGTHLRHSKRFAASTHLRCVFGTGAPACESHVAIGGSLLIFTGNPARVSDGTGIFRGATGRIVSSKDVPGSHEATDIVARIRLRR